MGSKIIDVCLNCTQITWFYTALTVDKRELFSSA